MALRVGFHGRGSVAGPLLVFGTVAQDNMVLLEAPWLLVAGSWGKIKGAWFLTRSRVRLQLDFRSLTKLMTVFSSSIPNLGLQDFYMETLGPGLEVTRCIFRSRLVQLRYFAGPWAR